MSLMNATTTRRRWSLENKIGNILAASFVNLTNNKVVRLQMILLQMSNRVVIKALLSYAVVYHCS